MGAGCLLGKGGASGRFPPWLVGYHRMMSKSGSRRVARLPWGGVVRVGRELLVAGPWLACLRVTCSRHSLELDYWSGHGLEYMGATR